MIFIVRIKFGQIIKFFIILILILFAIFIVFFERESDVMEVSYEEGILSDFILEDNVGVYHKELVQDKETALGIAKVVLNNVCKTKDRFNSVKVFYDIEKELWIVTFFKKDVLGGDVNIAIRKSNAQIVKVWSGE